MKDIASEWRSYKANVIPSAAPDAQTVECRRAFYAGAVAVLNLLEDGTRPDVDADQQRANASRILAELSEFSAGVKSGRF